MTFWVVVLLLGLVASALSWRAARRAYDGSGTTGYRSDPRMPSYRPSVGR